MTYNSLHYESNANNNPPLHIQIHRFKRSLPVMSYNFLDCFVTRSIIYVVLLHSVFEFPAVVCS